MKKDILILLALLAFPLLSIAQSVPEGFNYQAVVRDAAGNIKKEATVELQFSLLPSQFSSQASWVETHTVKTDQFGTCSLVIGSGQKVSGTAATFNEVDFSASSYWLKVELKEGGQYIELGGAQKLMSVPYARVAGKVAADVPTMPAGTIIAFGGNLDKIPAGWLLCTGSGVSRSTYQNLFNAIGTNWGVGNNATTFNLPDLRGMFLRGATMGTNRDPDVATRYGLRGGNIGDNAGSYQGESLLSHDHGFTRYSFKTHRARGGGGETLWANDSGARTTKTGGNETRPENAYVYYIIKY